MGAFPYLRRRELWHKREYDYDQKRTCLISR